MLEETGTKVSISTIKSYIDITWKAAQQGRCHCSKTAIKKQDYGLRLHKGTKMSSGLMRQKWNCLAIIMFGGKRGRLASRRTPSQPWNTGWQHHVVWVLCCRRDWCTSQNRWHHDVGKLWIYWSNISRHQSGSWSLVANGSSKWTMTPSTLPKLWQNGLKTTKSRYLSGHHKALTSIL